jgi:hypothetical protein
MIDFFLAQFEQTDAGYKKNLINGTVLLFSSRLIWSMAIESYNSSRDFTQHLRDGDEDGRNDKTAESNCHPRRVQSYKIIIPYSNSSVMRGRCVFQTRF